MALSGEVTAIFTRKLSQTVPRRTTARAPLIVTNAWEPNPGELSPFTIDMEYYLQKYHRVSRTWHVLYKNSGGKGPVNSSRILHNIIHSDPGVSTAKRTRQL